MENENTFKLDALGVISLLLSAITLLTLGAFILLVLRDYDVIDFRLRLRATTEVFLYWFSPLMSILTTIVANFARKSGSAKQRKVANWCASFGKLSGVCDPAFWQIKPRARISVVVKVDQMIGRHSIDGFGGSIQSALGQVHGVPPCNQQPPI